MNTKSNIKKNVALTAIMNVVTHTQDFPEAENFAQHNQTAYSTAFEAAKIMEQKSRDAAVIAYNKFIDYMLENGRLTLLESESRESWTNQFKDLMTCNL